MRVPKEKSVVRSLIEERDRLLQKVDGLNTAIEALQGEDTPKRKRRRSKARRVSRGRKRSSRVRGRKRLNKRPPRPPNQSQVMK